EPSRVYVLTPRYGLNEEIQSVNHIHPVDINGSLSVQDVVADDFGNVWLALYGNGLGFASHFKPFFQALPDVKAAVSGIAIDRQNSSWLITEGTGMLQWNADRNLIDQVKAPHNIHD